MKLFILVPIILVLISCNITKNQGWRNAKDTFTEGSNGVFTFASLVGGDVDKPTFYPNAGPAPLGEVDLDIATVSKCNPGDLDMGEKNFWKDVVPAAQAENEQLPTVDREGFIDTTDNPVYTVTVETFDGRVMGGKKLLPKDLVVKEQFTSLRTHKVVQNIPIKILPGLANGEAFPISIFVCEDANNNGKCADEAVLNINAEVNDKVNIDAPTPVKPVKQGKLLHSVQLMAAYRNGEMIVQDLNEAKGPNSIVDTSRANGSLARATATADVVQEYLKNLKPADAGQAGNPLAMVFGVEAKDAQACKPPPAAPPVHHVRTNGCFIAGTIIEIAGGKEIPVEKIFKGTEVLIADKRTATVSRSVAGPEKEPVIEIKSESGHLLVVTSKHPVVTKAGMKLAKDIKMSDLLIDKAGKAIKISSLKAKVYKGIVYNFALPGKKVKDHIVIAGGLQTGDLFIQQQMTAK